MRLPTRLGGCLLATVLTAGTAYAVPAVAAPPAVPPAPSGAGELIAATPSSRTLTLITGDRLLVSADGLSVTPLPVPGRTATTFVTERVDGHLSVTPADAIDLVNTGKVDERLFDVTTLVESGYDDSRPDLPLIVSYAGGDPGEKKVRTLVAAGEAEVTHELPSVDGLVVKQEKAQLGELWAELTKAPAGASARTLEGGIARVALDGIRKPLLDESVARIGAPALWAGGTTGKGAKVGLVDSGVDADHPDLAGRVVAQDFTSTGLKDNAGHGTHVASTIAGNGAASDGRYKGVAPEATVYSAKACVPGSCSESAIIRGMEWLSGQRIPVVNMSLGGIDSYGVDSLEAAVQNLSAANGTLFVVSAGNSRDDEVETPIGSPGSADSALTVASVTKQDVLSPFSSRGPRVADGVLKPEIAAPGSDITAARSALMGEGSGPYVALSGTSMAAPHVAGAATLLAQQHPDWGFEKLKSVLMAGSVPVADATVYDQGAGRLDIARASAQTVTTTPAAVTFGDGGGAGPITRTVTYANAGAAPITLDLSLETRGRNGGPAPAGMFTLGATRVTVPAGGQATVDIVGARGTHPVGAYSGWIVAEAAGERVVSTPFGLPPEAYTLSVTNINRAGQKTAVARVKVFDLDTGRVVYQNKELRGPTVTMHLPLGRYLVSSAILEYSPTFERRATLVTRAELVLDKSTALDLDARAAKPVSVSVTKPGAVLTGGSVNIRVAVGAENTLSFGLGGPLSEIYTARQGADRTGNISSTVNAHFAQQQPDGGVQDSPWTIVAALSTPGVVHGFDRTLREKEFATVETSFAKVPTGPSNVLKVSYPTWDRFGRDEWSGSVPLTVPNTRTDHYVSEGGVKWDIETSTGVQGLYDWFPTAYGTTQYNSVNEVTYKAGRTYRETWGRGVFGPAFPKRTQAAQEGVERVGNTLRVGVTMFGDDRGRLGFPQALVGQFSRLTRNGETVFAGPAFGGLTDLPAGDAEYKLLINLGQHPLAGLSTTNTATWTFRSAETAEDEITKLPVSVVRFLPELDENNAAAPGGYDFIPFEVQRQPGATAARTSAFEMTVSYDDGRTWVTPTIQRFGETGLALVKRPAGVTSGFVSVQSKATMTDGGIVEQRILRAFRF